MLSAFTLPFIVRPAFDELQVSPSVSRHSVVWHALAFSTQRTDRPLERSLLVVMPAEVP